MSYLLIGLHLIEVAIVGDVHTHRAVAALKLACSKRQTVKKSQSDIKYKRKKTSGHINDS